MLRNGLSEADREEAEAEIERMLPRLPHLPRDSGLIMQELVERSGVLREPQHNVIDFVHRTFLEYMGARAALGQGDRDALIGRANEESWRDVIVFAAGHAQGTARDELVERLLRRSRWIHTSIEADVTAVCCVETVGRNLDPLLLQRLHKRAKSLFPPRDFSRARVLAAAAANNPELLEGHEAENEETIAACVRTASIVGRPQMLKVILEYGGIAGDHIDQEITRAYQIFDDDSLIEAIFALRTRIFDIVIADLTVEHKKCLKLLLRYQRAGHGSYEIKTAFQRYQTTGVVDITTFYNSGERKTIRSRRVKIRGIT